MATTITDRMLKGSDFAVYLSAQTNKGALNASPVFTKFRRVSGKNSLTTSYTQSSEVQTDEQAATQIKERDEYTLEVESETSKQTIALAIAAIHAVEDERTDTDTVFAATGTGFTSTGGALGALAVADGDMVWFDGYVNPDLNRAYIVTAQADANTWTTYPAPAATEIAGASVTITSHKSVSAKAATYYGTQTRAPDDSKPGDIDYDTYYDGFIGSHNMEIPDSGPCTATTSIISEGKIDGQLIISGQTDAADPVDDAVNAVSGVVDFIVNNVSQKCVVKTMGVEINNNPQTDNAAACSGTRVVRGPFEVGGAISVRSMYSNPFVWRDYNRAGTNVSIGVLMEHEVGEQTYILMRSCKVTEATMPDDNQAIVSTDATYAAQRDDVTGTTIEIFRNWT